MRAQLGRSWWSVSLWMASGMVLAATEPNADAERARFVLRADSRHAQWLLDEGRRRSPTLRWLADEVITSDLIVHITAEPLVTLAGHTVFQVKAGGYRYVTVAISTRQTVPVQLATLAHELVHVLEIADAPEVTTGDDVRVLYERIGERTLGAARYETDTARRIGQRALAEVLSGRNAPVDVGALARQVRRGPIRAFRRDAS